MDKKELIPNQIWEKIKNIPISLYSLPAKPLSEFLEPKLNVPFEVLYVRPTQSGGNIISILEPALGPTFEVTTVDTGWFQIKELAPKPKL